MTAFAAVALLAVSANLVVEHGASVIQTTRTDAATWIVRDPPPATRPLHVLSTDSSPAPQSEKPVPLPAAELLEALNEFDRAVLLRAQTDTTANNTLLTAANDHLRHQVRLFVETARQPAPLWKEPGALELQVHANQSVARSLIATSDARHASFIAHRNHFENIDATLKHTLDHTWKIFGRIIARASLVTLSRELDEIRRRAAQLSPAGEYDATVLAALAQAEAEFAATLDHHRADLVRSQGTPWVAHIREEFAQLVASRLQLTSLDQEAAQASRTFERNNLLVKRAIRSIAQAAPETARHVSAAPKIVALAPSGPESTRAIVAMPPPRPSVTSSTTTIRSSFSAVDQLLIAALSAAVLLLLLGISVWTVRSIVIPVRGFLVTSERLAEGEMSARYPRGGIRELDALAISLNEMAGTLEIAQSIAREHQGALELRLEERARRLEQLARSDLLTGLPNKQSWMQHLEQLLDRAAVSSDAVAVLLLDLDDFKTVNDTMGHSFGDSLLRAVAQRLRSLAIPAGFAARMAGDEFAIALQTSESADELAKRATAIIQSFHAPLPVEGRELLITVSGGLSSHPHDGTSAEALLKAAEAALFRAKAQGRDQLSRFAPELLQKVSEKFNIVQGLGRALERNELELVFQPQVSLGVAGVDCVEALLRWRLPDGRRLSPMQFLTTAQEAGLINRIGDWVLKSSIEQAAAWHHGAWSQARVALNVNANQLLSGSFSRRVLELLTEHRLPAHCIEIELTETVLQTGAPCIDALRELRALGLGIALDDFGTGFSSLASLQHLPLTRVKLDRSLIGAIDTDARALAIANAIMALCAKLGLAITAEGIERSTQLALLLEHPSICLQGYLFSPPVEVDTVVATIAAVPEQLRALTVESVLSASGAHGQTQHPIAAGYGTGPQ